MRQTEADTILPSPSNRSSERPSRSSSQRRYRGRAGDGAECLAALNSKTIIFARTVAGMACRLRLTPKQFQGVAVIRRGPVSAIRLVHGDPALTIDLTSTLDRGRAEKECASIAALLDLPMLGGALRLIEAEPQKRRGTSAGKRRARFLKNRRTGHLQAVDPVEGEEMFSFE